jgi:hypothetical protein
LQVRFFGLQWQQQLLLPRLDSASACGSKQTTWPRPERSISTILLTTDVFAKLHIDLPFQEQTDLKMKL